MGPACENIFEFKTNDITKAPFTQGCDLRATLVRPQKWLGRSVVAGSQHCQFLLRKWLAESNGSWSRRPGENDIIVAVGFAVNCFALLYKNETILWYIKATIKNANIKNNVLLDDNTENYTPSNSNHYDIFIAVTVV